MAFMNWFMPLFLVVHLFEAYPAVLLLYWAVPHSSVFAQQWWVHRRTDIEMQEKPALVQGETTCPSKRRVRGKSVSPCPGGGVSSRRVWGRRFARDGTRVPWCLKRGFSCLSHKWSGSSCVTHHCCATPMSEEKPAQYEAATAGVGLKTAH